MTKVGKPNEHDYTDKRTGIVYTNVNDRTSILTKHTQNQNQIQNQIQIQPHLDAFIPDTFLKPYFGGKGKS